MGSFGSAPTSDGDAPPPAGEGLPPLNQVPTAHTYLIPYTDTKHCYSFGTPSVTKVSWDTLAEYLGTKYDGSLTTGHCSTNSNFASVINTFKIQGPKDIGTIAVTEYEGAVA